MSTSHTLAANTHARKQMKTTVPTTSDQCDVAAIWKGALTSCSRVSAMPSTPSRRPRRLVVTTANAVAPTKAAVEKFAR